MALINRVAPPNYMHQTSRKCQTMRRTLFLAGLASILLLGVACTSDKSTTESPGDVTVHETDEPTALPLVGSVLRPEGRWCASGRGLCFIDLSWREYSSDIAFG